MSDRVATFMPARNCKRAEQLLPTIGSQLRVITKPRSQMNRGGSQLRHPRALRNSVLFSSTFFKFHCNDSVVIIYIYYHYGCNVYYHCCYYCTCYCYYYVVILTLILISIVFITIIIVFIICMF